MDEPLQVETFDSSGSFAARYTYHADHLGSIRYLTDTSGAIVNAYDYDSYGRPMFGVTAFDQPFAYTGREWDAATGLYHYRARAYDAETGRFLQEDPIWFNAGDMNVYRYVENNPLMFTDPDGLSALETGGLTQVVGSAAPIANIGAGLHCLFASIGASIDAEVDFVSGRTGSGFNCSNQVLVRAEDVTITAGAILLGGMLLPVVERYELSFKLIALTKNTYEYTRPVCFNGTCDVRTSIFYR